MKIKHDAEQQKREMLEKVEDMKRFGKFTMGNMVAHGLIDPESTAA
jgi:hypothetical protein